MIRGIFFLLAMCALLLGMAHHAKAHSWYPANCCNLLDCYPMGQGEREPEPRITPQGYVFHDGRVIALQDARPSPDGRFHVCRRLGDPKGDIIHPAGEKPCFYAPQGLS